MHTCMYAPSCGSRTRPSARPDLTCRAAHIVTGRRAAAGLRWHTATMTDDERHSISLGWMCACCMHAFMLPMLVTVLAVRGSQAHMFMRSRLEWRSRCLALACILALGPRLITAYCSQRHARLHSTQRGSLTSLPPSLAQRAIYISARLPLRDRQAGRQAGRDSLPRASSRSAGAR